MAKSRSRHSVNLVEAYVRASLPQELELRWKKLRDDGDKLNNVLTVWCRAYAEHCGNVYVAEQEALRFDTAQNTKKHVAGLWKVLGVEGKAQCSKIRVIGKWFAALPLEDRDGLLASLPATKDAIYEAARFDGTVLKGALKSGAINPESTTAQFRAALGKATPQDRARNAKKPDAKPAGGASQSARGSRRVTVTCRTAQDVRILMDFVESHPTRFSVA